MAQYNLNNFQSPATGYEIILTELSKSQNSKDEKILKVFEVLDDMIPNLGVYYKIMRIVRQQLYDAVFSNEFTAARSNDESTDPKIQRKSYYLLYKDIKDLKDGKVDALKEELKQKDELLGRKEIMLNQFISLNENLKEEIAKAKKQIERLTNDIELKKTEIFHMQRNFNSTEELYKNKIESLENNIEFLNDDLESKMKEIKELIAYKQSFDDIHQKFSPAFADRNVKSAKKPIGLSKKNQVLTDIMNAKKFEEQLYTLINVSTEEYDDFMERQQEYLLEKFRKNLNEEGSSNFNRFNDTKPFLTLFEKEMLTHQMDAEKINYQKSIADLKNQYELIVQHRKSLEEKLTLLEQDRENTEFIKKQKSKATSAAQSNKGSAIHGLEEHYEPTRNGADKDPYGVQDRIYSKFACTMHVSSDAQYWHDFKLVKYCENCGDKTLICPHKLSMDETIIQLPNNSHYLKFSRPKLKINQTIVTKAIESFKKPDTKYQIGENAIVFTNYKTKYPIIERDDLNRETVNLLTKGNAAIGMPYDFTRVWKDYESKTQYKRLVQRPFTYQRTLSIINQFLAYLHNMALDRDYVPKDIVNSLYDYMDTRYENDEVKFCAVYDFFTSIHLYAMKSRYIETFCQVIVGNLDRGILNYILYMGEVIDKIDWQVTEDAKTFLAIIYPYCDEDDLENLALDFISFGENKINKKLVWEFIMSLVIKKRDYIVNEMEFRLKEKQAENENYMTENEFCEVMNEFFFIADERQTQVAYKMALAHAGWDGQQVVAIKKLSHIAAYYCLIQIINDLKENINKMIEDSRKKAIEHDTKFGAPMTKHQKSDYQDEFIKLSDIDDLATSITRFKNAEYQLDHIDEEHDNLLTEVANENVSNNPPENKMEQE